MNEQVPEKWRVISRDDNYIQIARGGLLVIHVLTAPGGDVSGRGVAAEIVRACNAHDALVAACRDALVEMGEHWRLLVSADKADDWEMMRWQLRQAIALATEANDD